MTGHDFNFGFVQLACLSTLYYYRYHARNANFKGKEIFQSTFSINLRSFFYSSLLGTKREESKTERKIKREREREEDFRGYFRQKQANARTRDRSVAGRVSLIRHRGITYGSLMSPYQRYLPIPWALLLPPVPHVRRHHWISNYQHHLPIPTSNVTAASYHRRGTKTF